MLYSLSRCAQCSVYACLILLFLVKILPSQETLFDESFETGQALPDGWQQGPAVPGVQFVYDRAVASNGKRSLSLQKSVERFFPIAQWYRSLDYNRAGTSLELKANVKAMKATKAIIELQFLDNRGSMIGKEWISFIGQKEAGDKPATHDWKEYSGKAVVPASTEEIVVALQIYGPGKVWFDELQLREAGAPSDKPKSTSQPPIANATSRAAELPQPQSLKTRSGGWTRFVLLPPNESTPKPSAGFPLLFILPGGDGSLDFYPFIKTIHSQAMRGQVAIVHVIAPPQVVWPTAQSRARYATTEDSLGSIIEDVSSKLAVDKTRVLALGWSSSGPSLYETLMNDDSPLAGAFIAMSVFREKDYASFESIKGRRVYLLHSPEDTLCPYSMAKEAATKLNASGATVKLVDYDGGHGWHGDVFNEIRTGVDWLWETK